MLRRIIQDEAGRPATGESGDDARPSAPEDEDRRQLVDAGPIASAPIPARGTE